MSVIYVKNLTGMTDAGIEVECLMDPDKGVVQVEYAGPPSLRFEFHPDFPQDAEALFVALCNVKRVTVNE